MLGARVSRSDGHGDVATGQAHALRAVAVERAGCWFPDLADGPVQVAVAPLTARPRCSLFVLTLTGGGGSHRAVAKLRRESRGYPLGSARPSLVPDAAVSPAEQAALEHAGLRAIAEAFGAADHRFGVVRALDLLPEMAGLVLEHVALPTARSAVLASSRLGPLLPTRALRGAAPVLFDNAGAWLRRFHGLTDQFELRDRGGSAADLAAAVTDYATFLARSLGNPGVAELGAGAGRVVQVALPDQMPRAVGHGDYAVRNMFVEPSGRLRVIDPMPRWRVPVYEDLARLLVGTRLLGLQVQTYGHAYPQSWLDAREADVLAGYFGPAAPARTAVRAYELVLLLDKWSALVSRRGAGRGPWARWADGYVEREGRRLLASLEAGQ